jgi:hypothetical protein
VEEGVIGFIPKAVHSVGLSVGVLSSDACAWVEAIDMAVVVERAFNRWLFFFQRYRFQTNAILICQEGCTGPSRIYLNTSRNRPKLDTSPLVANLTHHAIPSKTFLA